MGRRHVYHVIPDTEQGGWDVRLENESVAHAHFSRQEEAVAYARRISQSEGAEMHVHAPQGSAEGYPDRDREKDQVEL